MNNTTIHNKLSLSTWLWSN